MIDFGKISVNPEIDDQEVSDYYNREQKKRNVNLILSEEQKAKLLQTDVWKMCREIEGVKYRFAICRVYICVDQEWKYRFQGCLFLVEVVEGAKLVLVQVESMKIVWTHDLFLGFEMETRDDHFVVINDLTPDLAWGISFARLYPSGDFIKDTEELVERKCKPSKKEGGGLLKTVVSFFSGGASKISSVMSTPPPPTAAPPQVAQSQKQDDKDTKWMMNVIEEAGYKKEDLVDNENSRQRIQEYFSAYENKDEGKSMFEAIIDLPKWETDSPDVAYPDLDSLELITEIEIPKPKPQPKIEPQQQKLPPQPQPQPQYVPPQPQRQISHQYVQPQPIYQPQPQMYQQQQQNIGMGYDNAYQQQPQYQRQQVGTSPEQGALLEQQRKMKQLEQRIENYEQRDFSEIQKRQQQILHLKEMVAHMEKEKKEDLRLAQVKEKLLMVLLEQEARKKQRQRRRGPPTNTSSRYNVSHGLVGRNTFQEDYRM